MSAIVTLAAAATTGLSSVMLDGLVEKAGTDFRYAGVVGCDRPRGNYPTASGKCFAFREVLRTFLAAGAGGLCVQCGEALDNGEAVETCHVVSRGPAIRGFIPGNVFAGHKSCNSRTAAQFDAAGNVVSGVLVLTLDMLARPDLIVTEWPRWSALAAAGIADGYGVRS